MSFDDIPFENNGNDDKTLENKYNTSKSFVMKNRGYYVIPLAIPPPNHEYKLNIHNRYQCRFTIIYYALLFTLASRAFMQIIWRFVQTRIRFDRYDRLRNVPAMCTPDLFVQTQPLVSGAQRGKRTLYNQPLVLIHHQYRLEITRTTVAVAGWFV